jgi:hypothetical protein
MGGRCRSADEPTTSRASSDGHTCSIARGGVKAFVGAFRPYFWLLACAGLAGAVVTQLLWVRTVSTVAALSWSNWDSVTLSGAISGVLVGHAAFVLKAPGRRLSRAVVVCVHGNVAAWLIFLAFGERVTGAEFARSVAERARLDAGTGSLTLIHDAPTVVASRWVGSFGAVNAADRILSLFAGPAVGFSQVVVAPAGISIAEGLIVTPAASWGVAATAFLLSTTFWIAVGSVVSAVRRRRRARSLRAESDDGIHPG